MVQTDPPAAPFVSKRDEEEKSDLQRTDTSMLYQKKHLEPAIGPRFTAIFASRINFLLVFVPIGIALHEVKSVDRVTIFVLNFLAIVPLAAILSFATEELALCVGEALGRLMNASFRSLADASHFASNNYWKSMLQKLLKIARRICSCGQLSVCVFTLPFLLASAQPIEDVSGLAKTQSDLSAKTWVSIGCITLWAVGFLGAALTLQYNTSVNMGWLSLSGAFALMTSFAWLLFQTPSMYDTTDPFKYLVLAASHMFILWFVSQPSADTDRKTLLWTTFLGFAFILLIISVSIPAGGPSQADPMIPSGGVDMMIYAVKYWAPSPLYFIAWAILVRIVFYCFGRYFESVATELDTEGNEFELEPTAAQIASASGAQASSNVQVGDAGGDNEVSAT
jgi:hypothetical protein